MQIFHITDFLETLAPLALQEHYDNSGLQLGSKETDCRGVMVCLDVTEAVIGEAASRNCNLIVSHHPLIFRGLKQIDGRTGTGKTILAAVKQEIAVYAIHTNLDNVLPGVNSALADKLKLINRQFLLPKPGQGMPGERPAGSGLAGDLPQALDEKQFLRLIREQFGIPVIRHSALNGQPVRRVAVCGGAGSFLITSALHQKADFFISADLKYHEFFEAEGRLVIADIGHYESEQFTMDLLCDGIVKKFPNFAVLKAGVPTNPVHYYF